MKQPIISDGNIKPEWDRAAMELSGKVHMGKVFSKDLARQSGVKYFPTIIYFPAGDKSEQNSFENYEGDITTNDIVTWALQVVVCQKDLFFHQLSQNCLGMSECFTLFLFILKLSIQKLNILVQTIL